VGPMKSDQAGRSCSPVGQAAHERHKISSHMNRAYFASGEHETVYKPSRIAPGVAGYCLGVFLSPQLAVFYSCMTGTGRHALGLGVKSIPSTYAPI
jgi:hypothetical protein